jgi:hypothetical protein
MLEAGVADATNNVSVSKKTTKRAKKTESDHRTYINPFVSEPSLTVAEHKAHSHALSQAQHIELSNHPLTEGQSLFSKSLASTSDQMHCPHLRKTVLCPQCPITDSCTTHARSSSPPKSKIASSKARNASVAPAHRPFLVPPSTHASSPALPDSTRSSMCIVVICASP